jgi:hypothetical protein
VPGGPKRVSSLNREARVEENLQEPASIESGSSLSLAAIRRA